MTHMNNDGAGAPDIAIRPMRANDLDDGVRLCTLAGWNQLRADWALFLQANPRGCFVADAGGRIVGTVTTIDYGGELSWIAMVLVDPAMRRMGIGSRLMGAAIDALAHCNCIKLDATPDGKAVYDRLGFVDECTFERMIVPAAPSCPVPDSVRPMTDDDLEAVVALDAEAFGMNRRSVICGFRAIAPEYAFVAESPTGEPAGFCLGRHGARFEHIGPVEARDTTTAQALVSAALAAMGGKPAGLDVLGRDPDWLGWIRARGFVSQRSFVRMYLKNSVFSTSPALMHAITGPELG